MYDIFPKCTGRSIGRQELVMRSHLFAYKYLLHVVIKLENTCQVSKFVYTFRPLELIVKLFMTL